MVYLSPSHSRDHGPYGVDLKHEREALWSIVHPGVTHYGASSRTCIGRGDPTFAFNDNNIITRCCCNNICGEKATPGCYHSIFCHLIKNWIFGHFWPFVPVRGQALDPNSAFIDKAIITGCCCNDIYGKKATAGYYHPIFPPLA